MAKQGKSKLMAGSNRIGKNILNPMLSYIKEIEQIREFLEKKVYPYNPDLAELWMKSPNSDFEGMSPSEVIFKEGMKGIEKVRDYLTYHVQGEI